MKKIILSILALACGVFAQAKTLEELVAGMPPYGDSASAEALRVAYVDANRADFDREFAEYLRSGIATKNYSQLTPSERNIRNVFRPLYSNYGANYDVPDAVAIRLAASAFYRFTGDAKYRSIKAAGWKIEGEKLPSNIVFTYAKAARDDAFILSMNIEQVRRGGNLKTWSKMKAKALFKADDKTAAYNEASKLEGELRGLCDDSADVQYAIRQFMSVTDYQYVDTTRRNRLK